MSPGPCQDQLVVAVIPDQQPVGLYVAFSVALPPSQQAVSPIAVGESAPGLEMSDHIPQFLQVFAAPGRSLWVIPESTGVSQSHGGVSRTVPSVLRGTSVAPAGSARSGPKARITL